MFKSIIDKLFGEPRPLSPKEDFIQANRLVFLAAMFKALYVILYVGSALNAHNTLYLYLFFSYVLIEEALMMISVACAIQFDFNSPKLPSIMLGIFLLFDSVLYTMMGYLVLFSFLLTIVLCARYHSVQIVLRTAVVGALCFFLSGFVGVVLDSMIPILNDAHTYLGLDFDNLLLFTLDHVPAFCVYLLACAISYGITVSGIGLQKGGEELARARADMNAAAHIQRQLAPSFIDFGADSPFDFYATIKPINVTSGDYYDGVLVGNRYFFEVADVSDKGLPAAMFAMRAQSLLRQCATESSLLKGVVEANHALCQNNESCMFVTVVLGVLDLQTGHVAYVNAGHEPIAIRRGEDVELLELDHPSPALGLFEDADFQVRDLMLGEGDALFAFTDGVTDAANTSGDRFGTARLAHCLRDSKGDNAKSTCDKVLSAVSDFYGTVNQNDDITVLSLCCLAAPGGFTLHKVVDCNAKRLGEATREVLDQVERVCCPEEVRAYIGTIIDEVGSNIIEHAYEDVSGRVFEMDCQAKPGSVSLCFADEGMPFDPLEEEKSYVEPGEESIEELRVGNWGIHLVCNLADSVSYERKGAYNVLTVELRW